MACSVLQSTMVLRHTGTMFSISDFYLFHKFHFQLLT